MEMTKWLDEQGNLIGDVAVPSDDVLKTMYAEMKRGRMIDTKMFKMQRQGRMALVAPVSGQEAIQVASALVLNKEDWIAPSYRDSVATMLHGMPLENIIRYFKGYSDGGGAPEGVNVLPVQIIIAAQMLHATGVAFASKIKGEQARTVTFFGDGATSQGDFHEALNFAAVYKLPVIFVCQNNQYAISTPVSKQMNTETIVERAKAYNMAYEYVDGNDILACYDVMKRAYDKAQDGPVFVEAVTYRLGPHTTSDDPKKYREQTEEQQWQQKDPLVRMRAFLEARGLWDAAFERAIEDRASEEIEEAVAKIEETPPPTLADMLEKVYETPPTLIQEQINGLRGNE